MPRMGHQSHHLHTYSPFNQLLCGQDTYQHVFVGWEATREPSLHVPKLHADTNPGSGLQQYQMV